MGRKSPALAAKDALNKLLSMREAAKKRLEKIEEEIKEMSEMLGVVPAVSAPQTDSKFHFPSEPILEEKLELPEDLNPADNMGAGRLI